MSKPTKSSVKSKTSKNKSTRVYNKRMKSDSELTKNELIIRKQRIDEYCKKMLKRYDETYSKYYFSNNANDFPKLVLYYKYDYSNDINEKLEGINFERIEKETTDNILEALKQAKQIVNVLGRSYKQKIIDSDELTQFLLALLELDKDGRHKQIRRYELAQDLFNTSLKILVEESPKPIQNHLIRSMKDFFDMVDLPTELGYTKGKRPIKPVIKEDPNDGSFSIELETGLEKRPQIRMPKKRLSS